MVTAYLRKRQQLMAETTLLYRAGQYLSATAGDAPPVGHAVPGESNIKPSFLRRLVLRG